MFEEIVIVWLSLLTIAFGGLLVLAWTVYKGIQNPQGMMEQFGKMMGDTSGNNSGELDINGIFEQVFSAIQDGPPPTEAKGSPKKKGMQGPKKLNNTQRRKGAPRSY